MCSVVVRNSLFQLDGKLTGIKIVDSLAIVVKHAEGWVGVVVLVSVPKHVDVFKSFASDRTPVVLCIGDGRNGIVRNFLLLVGVCDGDGPTCHEK